jgi:hypothetical protein
MKKKQRHGKWKSIRGIAPKPRFSARQLTSRANFIPMSRFMDELVIQETMERMVTVVRGSMDACRQTWHYNSPS